MHHPIDKIVHATAFATPVVEHWLEQGIAKKPTKKTLTQLIEHEAMDLKTSKTDISRVYDKELFSSLKSVQKENMHLRFAFCAR